VHREAVYARKGGFEMLAHEAAGACQPGQHLLPRYGQILVALDGSELSERILPHVQALAAAFEARVTLLHVIAPPPLAREVPEGALPGAQPPAERLAGTDRELPPIGHYLAGVAARLRDTGLRVEYTYRQGPVATTVVEHARDLRADLIAMITHGHGALARMVIGSVATEVLRAAPCPVFLVRAHEPAVPTTWHLPAATTVR
jgi:nucleotide-binding universal stress UspA family protein